VVKFEVHIVFLLNSDAYEYLPTLVLENRGLTKISLSDDAIVELSLTLRRSVIHTW